MTAILKWLQGVILNVPMCTGSLFAPPLFFSTWWSALCALLPFTAARRRSAYLLAGSSNEAPIAHCVMCLSEHRAASLVEAAETKLEMLNSGSRPARLLNYLMLWVCVGNPTSLWIHPTSLLKLDHFSLLEPIHNVR